jgi:hypothetical protein
MEPAGKAPLRRMGTSPKTRAAIPVSATAHSRSTFDSWNSFHSLHLQPKEQVVCRAGIGPKGSW